VFKQRDMYLVRAGRRASAAGFSALLIGVGLSQIMELNIILSIFIPLVLGYVFLSSYWGGYKTHLWFNKYRYRMPTRLWWGLRYPVIFCGGVLGIFLWGFMEHFFLLMAIMTKADRGLFLSQLILMPYVGSWVAAKI